MFSPIARDRLRPQLFERMDSLMRPDLPFVEDPWNGDYSKLSAISHTIKDFLCRNRSSAFQLFMNVKQFQPQDLYVKVVGRDVVVHGKHSNKSDTNVHASGEFTRRCKIPDNVDPKTLICTFKKSGLLVIKADAGKPECLSSDGEETIPIEIQRPLIMDKVVTEEKEKNLDCDIELNQK